MAAAPLSLTCCSAVLQTYEGRDKAARFLQFAARFLVGITSSAQGLVLLKLGNDARKLLSAMTTARRTFRLGRELPVLLSVPDVLRRQQLSDRVLELAQKVALVMYFLVDHIGWLKQVRSGAKSGSKTIQLGLKWLAISSLISMLNEVRKCRSESGEPCKARGFNILRDSLVAVQALHLSRWLEVGDATIGIFGMASSIMDIMRVWPADTTFVSSAKALQISEADSLKRQLSSESTASYASSASQRSPDREIFA
ncbi:unnamed protein product [Effrenium voratum]|nr:unnamed protein product [Effrenium voratum]|mmetsp:Transcript_47523/g.113042  ORF Transcript_47523/g.113042 Transcript_47523/m.113042 type:complete len:254 (-) Transcript_47523:209-970(-)|eukprot:CAMPEP_0181454136 /NCGR_PEP_ID=MMETSP1110-20121109/30081_1 /TAXON_ID=174948 /ORGANISM="Symbiodinium sp., Strain CCMP421" /LENGTH=253 /DNA_ID=CAMNT_0023578469 /DNA_START=41 /DNA_END=802 /DNA_ORIENTATION=+